MQIDCRMKPQEGKKWLRKWSCKDRKPNWGVLMQNTTKTMNNIFAKQDKTVIKWVEAQNDNFSRHVETCDGGFFSFIPRFERKKKITYFYVFTHTFETHEIREVLPNTNTNLIKIRANKL